MKQNERPGKYCIPDGVRWSCLAPDFIDESGSRNLERLSELSVNTAVKGRWAKITGISAFAPILFLLNQTAYDAWPEASHQQFGSPSITGSSLPDHLGHVAGALRGS